MSTLMLMLASCAGSAPPAQEVPVAEPIVEEAPPTAAAVEPIPESGAFTRQLAPGLSLAAFLPVAVDGSFHRVDPAHVAHTDRRLFVLTVDPALHELQYVSVLQPGQESTRTASAWARHLGAVAVWNPGMFEPDGRATGYTRSGTFVSQPAVRRNALYGGFFTVSEGRASVVQVALPGGTGTYRPYTELGQADRATLDAAELVSQSLTVMAQGRGVYPPRTRYWSELAYGVDRQGRVVVVFSRYPYEMREFGARVAALDIGITDLVHGEGGPEATLAVAAPGLQWSTMGSYETGFWDDRNHEEWALPAVIAVVPRQPSATTTPQ